MNIKKTKISSKKSKARYNIIIETMTGDADDDHVIDYDCDNEEDLRDVIIHTEVMMHCFPNGQGGGDCYDGPYYEKYFNEGALYYSEHCQMEDSIRSYEIFYYDDAGSKYSVEVEFDEEMKEEIRHPKMDEDMLQQLEYPKDIKFR